MRDGLRGWATLGPFCISARQMVLTSFHHCESMETRQNGPEGPAHGGKESQMKYMLRRPDILRILMEQGKDGRPVTLEDLGEAAGVSRNIIWRITNGHKKEVTAEMATAIANRIGCAVGVLWSPCDWEHTGPTSEG